MKNRGVCAVTTWEQSLNDSITLCVEFNVVAQTLWVGLIIVIDRSVEFPTSETGYIAGMNFVADDCSVSFYILVSWTFVGFERGCYSFSSLQHRGFTRFLYCNNATFITKVIVVFCAISSTGRAADS